MALCCMLVLSTIFPAVSLAAGNRIYVTPSTGSLQPGQSITVQVKADVATGSYIGADTVSGTLQFPANLLKVTSTSTSGATFNWQASATPGNGVVNFSERAFYPVNDTTIFIMSVTFQALAAGSANLSFSGTTRLSSSFGTNYPTALAGGSYTISNPPPTTCPAGQIGTPPNCTTPPPAKCPTGQVGTPPNCTTPAPAKCPTGQTGTPPNCKTPSSNNGSSGSSGDKTPAPAPAPAAQTPTEPIPEPQENGLSISEASTTRAYSTASLNWKTSATAKNTVTYGTSLRQLDKTAEVTQEADGSYSAKLTDLAPGKRYYFTINSESEKDATKTSTYSGVFTTKGFPVSVTITDGGKAASSAKVKISEQNYSTDKSGKISFELASGSYTIEVTTATSSKKFTLAVAAKTIPDSGKAPDTQNFTFDIPTETASSGGLSPITLLGIGVGALATIGLLGGLFLFWRRRKAQQGTQTASVDTDYTWSAQQPLPAFPQDQLSSTPEAPLEQPMAMNMEYAAPPDMAPPQEIMPPDQAAAMALQDLPPLPEEPAPEMQGVESPPSDTTLPVEPAYDTSQVEQQNETVPLSQEQGAAPSSPIDTSLQEPYPAPAMDDTASVEPVVPLYEEQIQPTETEPTSPETNVSTPDQSVENSDITSPDEPGLTDTPPTTESGKGELQIDHHQESEPQTEDTSEAPSPETLAAK